MPIFPHPPQKRSFWRTFTFVNRNKLKYYFYLSKSYKKNIVKLYRYTPRSSSNLKIMVIISCWATEKEKTVSCFNSYRKG